MESTKGKKKKLIGYIIKFMIMIALVACYFSFAFRESAVHQDFPIPVGAKIIKDDKKEMTEEYEWGPASEEDGLPLYYSVAIRLWGWKKISQEGGMTYYEKDGEKLSVSPSVEYLVISR